LLFWAQPSGYFIEKPSALSVRVRKTWLSGMSPAATEAASPVRAPGACVVPAGVEAAAPGVAADEAVAAGVALAVGDVDDAEPQPTAAKAAASAATAPKIAMVLRACILLLLLRGSEIVAAALFLKGVCPQDLTRS
jgi:type IV secretory pathway TrbL component